MSLEKAVDQGEQYSRRNCLRITGVPEEATENTDEIVLKLAFDLGTDIRLSDIDRSHRFGRIDSARARPRDIIVKFATRQKLYKVRSSLKDKVTIGSSLMWILPRSGVKCFLTADLLSRQKVQRVLGLVMVRSSLGT